MIYKWNVYKIFNNGKRAKDPLHNFDCSVQDLSDGYFDKNIKKNLTQKFGIKIKNNKFSILRADISQETKIQENDDDKNKKLRSQVFAKYLNAKEFNKAQMECVLLFSGSTNWLWKWCVVHIGTVRVLEYISPGEKSYEEAHEWMIQQINQL